MDNYDVQGFVLVPFTMSVRADSPEDAKAMAKKCIESPIKSDVDGVIFGQPEMSRTIRYDRASK